jgi:hypothetical protein
MKNIYGKEYITSRSTIETINMPDHEDASLEASVYRPISVKYGR